MLMKVFWKEFTQPQIYMTGAVNGTLICMLMYVQQQIYVITLPRSSDCLKKEEKKKILQRKSLMQMCKKCALNITHKVTTQTVLKESLFSSSLKL